MKTFTIKTLGLSACMLVAAFAVNAQGTAIHTPVGVTARLSDQVTVTKVSDVDFGGIFIPKTDAATITMDNKGVVTVGSAATTLYSTNLQTKGQVKVEGNDQASFKVTYATTLNLQYNSQVLAYTPVLYEADGTVIAATGDKSFDIPTKAEGALEDPNVLIDVAGSLVVPTTALSGTYKGTLDVVVTWE